MADTKPTAAAVAVKPKTITLTFGDEDSALYELIISDAKADRRSAAQFLVIYLASSYESPNGTSKS